MKLKDRKDSEQTIEFWVDLEGMDPEAAFRFLPYEIIPDLMQGQAPNAQAAIDVRVDAQGIAKVTVRPVTHSAPLVDLKNKCEHMRKDLAPMRMRLEQKLADRKKALLGRVRARPNKGGTPTPVA